MQWIRREQGLPHLGSEHRLSAPSLQWLSMIYKTQILPMTCKAFCGEYLTFPGLIFHYVSLKSKQNCSTIHTAAQTRPTATLPCPFLMQFLLPGLASILALLTPCRLLLKSYQSFEVPPCAPTAQKGSHASLCLLFTCVQTSGVQEVPSTWNSQERSFARGFLGSGTYLKPSTPSGNSNDGFRGLFKRG